MNGQDLADARAAGRANADALVASTFLSVNEPEVYHRGARHSYFEDVIRANRNLPGCVEANERLLRHSAVADKENRALDTVDGNGGHFVPPAWMVSDYIKLARAGRAYADLAQRVPLPERTNTLQIPKVVTGTAVAAQSPENTAIAEQDLEDIAVTVPVRTIAGGQDVSLQLLEQSPVNFDELVFADLLAAYSVSLDQAVLTGSGTNGQLKGVRNTPGISSVAITGPVTVAKFYAAIANAVQKVHTSRFLAPTHIVMHPRRWAWLTGAVDNNQRPLVLPPTFGLNGLATLDAVASQQVVGELQGLPVVTDPNIGITYGSGENPSEDIAYVQRSSDLMLAESGTRTRVMNQIGGKTLTVHLQLHAYAAFTAERYPQSIVEITGLTAPDFGG